MSICFITTKNKSIPQILMKKKCKIYTYQYQANAEYCSRNELHLDKTAVDFWFGACMFSLYRNISVNIYIKKMITQFVVMVNIINTHFCHKPKFFLMISYVIVKMIVL